MTAPAGAPDGNLIGSMPGETVGELDASQKFWRDTMGLQATGDRAFSKDKAMLDLMGLPDGAEFRTASGLIPGSKVRMEFIEIRNAGRGRRFRCACRTPARLGLRFASRTSRSCCRA